jgi:HEPN domain-containing protein
VNRNDFRELARVRLREAQALLQAGHYSGAYYLAGYAVECALKACIAKMTKAGDFPDLKTVQDSYTHNLSQLAKVARLEAERDRMMAEDPVFAGSWGGSVTSSV